MEGQLAEGIGGYQAPFQLALAAQLEQAFGQKILRFRAVGAPLESGGIVLEGAHRIGKVVVGVEGAGHVELDELARPTAQFVDPPLLQSPVESAGVHHREFAQVLDPISRRGGPVMGGELLEKDHVFAQGGAQHAAGLERLSQGVLGFGRQDPPALSQRLIDGDGRFVVVCRDIDAGQRELHFCPIGRLTRFLQVAAVPADGPGMVAAPLVQLPQFAQAGDRLGTVGRGLEEFVEEADGSGKATSLAVGYGQTKGGSQIVGVVRCQLFEQLAIVAQSLVSLTALAPGVGQAEKRPFLQPGVGDRLQGRAVGVAGLEELTSVVQVVGPFQIGAVGLARGAEALLQASEFASSTLLIAQKKVDAAGQQQGGGRLGRRRFGRGDGGQLLLGFLRMPASEEKQRQTEACGVCLRLIRIFVDGPPVGAIRLLQLAGLGIIGAGIEQDLGGELADAESPLYLFIGVRRLQVASGRGQTGGPFAACGGDLQVVGMFLIKSFVRGNGGRTMAAAAVGPGEHEATLGQVGTIGIVADVLGEEFGRRGVVAGIPE